MNGIVTAGGATLSPIERQHVRTLVGRVTAHFRKILSLEWAFGREGHGYIATCRVLASSGYFRATALASSHAEAMDQVADAVLRQRRRALKKAISARRQI